MLIIIFLLYTGYYKENLSMKTELNEENAALISKELKKEQIFLQNLLEASLYKAADEMASHGGFTVENMPPLKHMGIPFWFYKGRVVNIPSTKAMEQMMAEEVTRLIISGINAHKEIISHNIVRYKFAPPNVKIKLYDESIEAEVNQIIEIDYKDKKTKSSLSYRAVLPIRLKKIRDMAEEYVIGYSRVRLMESSLIAGMRNDHRIYEPPGRPMHSVSCKNPPYKTYEEMIEPMRENSLISVARELQRIRVVFNSSKYIDWNMELKPDEVKFSFTADNGKYGHEHDRIYLVPTMLAPFSPKSDVCISSYLVRYDIYFPVRYTITDLKPVSKLVSTEEGRLIKPLEFSFYMMVYLGSKPDGSADPFAVDSGVSAPSKIEDTCQGACKIYLNILNAKKGKVWLDSCESEFTDGKYIEVRSLCGVHDLVVESTDPIGLGRYVEKINIQGEYRADIIIPQYATIEGRLLEINTVYCEKSKKIENRGFIPLKYTEGLPPRYIEVIFQPLNDRLGTAVRVEGDKEGRYAIERILPGKYLVIARPSRDMADISAFKVQPAGMILYIKPGYNKQDIIFRPANVMLVNGKYQEVANVESC